MVSVDRQTFLGFEMITNLRDTSPLERFPIECRKTKTKVITVWPIATDVNNTTSQSEFEIHVTGRRQARENACGENTIGFGLDSHALVEKVARVLLTNYRA